MITIGTVSWEQYRETGDKTAVEVQETLQMSGYCVILDTTEGADMYSCETADEETKLLAVNDGAEV